MTAPAVVPAVIASAPALQLSATSGYQSQPVTITGTGFNPNGLVDIQTSNSRFRGTFPVDAAGTFSTSLLIDGGDNVGPLTISALENGTNASASYTVLPPASTISATSGTRGSTFTVSGAGYLPGETQNILMGGFSLGAAQVMGDGTYSIQVEVPQTIAAGPQILQVFSGRGTAPQFTFTVLAPAPSLTISPNSGLAGATFTVTSGGYIPGETEQVLFGPNNEVLLQFTVSTDAPTAYQVMVPNNAATGANTVTTVGSRTTTALTARYTVIAATNPAIALSADKGPAGTRFVISGTGYTPGITATATFGAGGAELGSAVAGTDGTFRIDATTPAAAAGTRDIVVTAPGTTGLSAPFTVQTEPVSPVSAPVSPVSAPAPGATPAAGSTSIPAADSTATRGLQIQTAAQAIPAAPSNGSAMIFWLCGFLILGLTAAVALPMVARKRRA